MLGIFGLSFAWGVAARTIGIDFYQFWAVGQALDRSDVTSVYSEEGRRLLGKTWLETARRTRNPRQIAAAEHRQKFDTYSSPFLYSLFRLFSIGDYETDFRNYRLLVLGCLVLSVALLSLLLSYTLGAALGAFAIFSTWFSPFSTDMLVGNVDTIQVTGLTLYLWVVLRMKMRYRDASGGALLGLLVTFKPNVIFVVGVLVLHWMLSGRIRCLVHHGVGAVSGAIIGVVIAVATFGSARCWVEWIAAVRAHPDEIAPVELGNYALARILAEWLGANIAADVAILLAIVLGSLTVIGMWLRRVDASGKKEASFDRNAFSGVLVVSIGCLLVVLVPHLVWLHYYVLTIPAFLVLFSPLNASSSSSDSGRYIVALIALCGLAINPIAYAGVSLPPVAQGVLVVFATLMLFVLTVFPRDVRRQARNYLTR